MTNEQLFNDIKRFIATTISQQMADIATKEDVESVEQHLSQRIDALDAKIGRVQADISDTLEKVLEALDVTEQVRDLDKRVRKLEHKVA